MGIIKSFETSTAPSLDLSDDSSIATMLADYDRAVEDKKRAEAVIEAMGRLSKPGLATMSGLLHRDTACSHGKLSTGMNTL
jgi:hypothetical protein